jgi:hypothetical protein
MKSKSAWLVALALACAAIAWFAVKSWRARRRGLVTLQAEIERCTVLGRRLQDLLVGKQLTLGATAKTPDRDKLLTAFWGLIVDYHEGMLGLMRQKLYGSAFALLRPTMEALIRAHVVRAFPQADVDRIKADKYATDFGTIGAKIDAEFGYPGIFTRFLKDKNILHSFTHSGMPQLGRRFKGADLEVNFEPEEVINFAHISTSALALVTILLAAQFGLKAEAEEANRLYVEWGGAGAAAAGQP